MIRTLVIAAALLGAGVAASSQAQAQAYGSYQATCPEVYQNGPYLQGVCLNAFGQGVRTSLDLRSCGGGPVSNSNGRLTCRRGGYGGGGYGGGYGGWR